MISSAPGADGRARLVSAIVLATIGATIAVSVLLPFLLALSSSPQTSIISWEMEAAEIAAGVAIGTAAFALPWALAGAALGGRISRARRLLDVVGLGALTALAVTCLGVGLPAVLFLGVSGQTPWARYGAITTLALLPFAVAAVAGARALIRRGALPDRA